MSTEIYERPRIELIFFKENLNGLDSMTLAGFCFVEVAKGKSFVMPLPTNIRISDMHGTNCGIAKTDIVGIHVLDRKTAIPQQAGVAKVGCQFFGDV